MKFSIVLEFKGKKKRIPAILDFRFGLFYNMYKKNIFKMKEEKKKNLLSSDWVINSRLDMPEESDVFGIIINQPFYYITD